MKRAIRIGLPSQQFMAPEISIDFKRKKKVEGNPELAHKGWFADRSGSCGLCQRADRNSLGIVLIGPNRERSNLELPVEPQFQRLTPAHVVSIRSAPHSNCNYTLPPISPGRAETQCRANPPTLSLSHGSSRSPRATVVSASSMTSNLSFKNNSRSEVLYTGRVASS
ncbi:hypothetical protein VTK26DRAFT_5337 [Humicola hyalothermophila]